MMHQSFSSPATKGLGNSGDIDFFFCKAWVYALHHWRKFLVNSPHIAPATPRLFSLLLPWLYLEGNQKPCTTIALLGQGEVLKPRSPQQFPGRGVASVADDCCIKMAHQACMNILNIQTIQSSNSVLVTLVLF